MDLDEEADLALVSEAESAEVDCVFNWAEHPFADPLQPRVQPANKAAAPKKKSACAGSYRARALCSARPRFGASALAP